VKRPVLVLRCSCDSDGPPPRVIVETEWVQGALPLDCVVANGTVGIKLLEAKEADQLEDADDSSKRVTIMLLWNMLRHAWCADATLVAAAVGDTVSGFSEALVFRGVPRIGLTMTKYSTTAKFEEFRTKIEVALNKLLGLLERAVSKMPRSFECESFTADKSKLVTTLGRGRFEIS